MQVISDLQQRPDKGRLRIEKLMVPVYDLCTLVQFVSYVVHTTSTAVASSRTFTHSLWTRNPLELVPALRFKLAQCNVTLTRDSLYAFNDVQLTLGGSNVAGMFADNFVGMRLGVIIGAVALALAAVNRTCVEVNFFYFKIRSLYLYKDILSALEIAMYGYLLQIALEADTPAVLLRDFMGMCNIRSKAYLPFLNVISLYVMVGMGFFSYIIGIVMYLFNALPKYGIMTKEEAKLYKEWARAKKMEELEMKEVLGEAKKANARLHLLQQMRYQQTPAHQQGKRAKQPAGQRRRPQPPPLQPQLGGYPGQTENQPMPPVPQPMGASQSYMQPTWQYGNPPPMPQQPMPPLQRNITNTNNNNHNNTIVEWDRNVNYGRNA